MHLVHCFFRRRRGILATHYNACIQTAGGALWLRGKLQTEPIHTQTKCAPEMVFSSVMCRSVKTKHVWTLQYLMACGILLCQYIRDHSPAIQHPP